MKISTLNNLDRDVWHMILDNLYVDNLYGTGEQETEQSPPAEDAEETPAQPRDGASADIAPVEPMASASND